MSGDSWPERRWLERNVKDAADLPTSDTGKGSSNATFWLVCVALVVTAHGCSINKLWSEHRALESRVAALEAKQ